ncbi:MAG: MBL fold metallo-hydrolase [Anaerolineae bacterium]|nr:MBL fold metallo-hydrolase [Anaerolineae bacterium]
MKLTFVGGARKVTGSMHLLEVNRTRVLLDCGLTHGHRGEAYQTNVEQAALGAHADALVLSHAHIDHSGNIPTLAKQGFTGDIWSTSATRDLCAAMLRDSAHLQAEDAAFLNKRRRAHGEPPVEPLYGRADADACMGLFVGINYGRSFSVADGVRVTFLDAGHILGSALTLLELQEKGRRLRLGYTGDLGRADLPILRDPEQLQDVDYLIMESTYGGRPGQSPDEARMILKRVINETYARGGKVIVPAFAVGRTQEIVYDLYVLRQERKVPDIPVYVDSPLAVDATEIFRLHPECYDREMAEILERDQFGPLGHSQVRYVRRVDDSKELNFLREPAVIISASGMAEGGRILHHLKNNLGDERNTVLFVGYQAENTLGRRIQDGASEARIFDDVYPVRARVESVQGYSAHADHDGLVAHAERAARSGRLRGIFLVHGEDDASLALSEALKQRGLPGVTVPKPSEEVTL